MAIPSAYFTKVIADLAQTYGLTGTGDHVDETSPVVSLCVRYAYAQIMAYTHSSFHKIERTTCYYEVYGPLQLKYFPLDTTATIEVWIDTVLTPDTDYVIDGNVFYIGEVADPTICYEFPHFIKIKSTSGYDDVTEDDIISTALLMQGIANYNRRDLLGFVEVKGEGGVTRAPSDRGGIIQAVTELLSGHVYYGNAVACS